MHGKGSLDASAQCERGAATYDRFDGPLERLAFRRWRERLWAQVRGQRILEVGVGTGRNMPFYPPGSDVTAIDQSANMLGCARWRADALGLHVDLRVMDAQKLEFADQNFDAAVATLVFCSVPDPVAGLRELGRVLRTAGRIYLLEHMRADREWQGRVMDGLDWFLARFSAERVARRTLDNVRVAGLQIERMENVMRGGVVKLIVAKASQGPPAARRRPVC